MKVKDFVDNLNKLLKERPEIADFDVVTSRDDEGNGYTLVYYSPSVGRFEDDEFTAEQENNALCVN